MSIKDDFMLKYYLTGLICDMNNLLNNTVDIKRMYIDSKPHYVFYTKNGIPFKTLKGDTVDKVADSVDVNWEHCSGFGSYIWTVKDKTTLINSLKAKGILI